MSSPFPHVFSPFQIGPIELRNRKSHERILRAPVIVIPCLYLADLDVYPDADRNAAEAIMAICSGVARLEAWPMPAMAFCGRLSVG